MNHIPDAEEVQGPMKALDIFGQELQVGDTVTWAIGGRYNSGLGVGVIAGMKARKTYNGYIVPPVYEEQEVISPWNGQPRKVTVKVQPGVLRAEPRATLILKIDQRMKGRRKGVDRKDASVLKVVIPGDAE